MKIYLDNNAYNRPFDDLSIMRNREEAKVIEAFLDKVAVREVDLTSSFIVETENSLSPDKLRRSRIRALTRLSSEYVGRSAEITQRAKALANAGMSGGDALHLAAAESAEVDYFVTCDDKLIKKARRVGSFVKVVSPLEIREEGWL